MARKPVMATAAMTAQACTMARRERAPVADSGQARGSDQTRDAISTTASQATAKQGCRATCGSWYARGLWTARSIARCARSNIRAMNSMAPP